MSNPGGIPHVEGSNTVRLLYTPATCFICNQEKPCAKWRLMIHETFWNNYRVCLHCWCKISDFIQTITE